MIMKHASVVGNIKQAMMTYAMRAMLKSIIMTKERGKRNDQG